MYWYLKVLKQYADFSGRARRKEYWMFLLFNLIFALVALIFDNVLGISSEDSINGPIYSIYTIAMLIPGLAVGIRRLHDVGKSGYTFLIILIPIIGAIWLLALYCNDSQQGTNKWGQDPKELSS
jgi:uncharacterized membrane protein YhaH (DUF805 family)